jgi:hypothetical protein
MTSRSAQKCTENLGYLERRPSLATRARSESNYGIIAPTQAAEAKRKAPEMNRKEFLTKLPVVALTAAAAHRPPCLADDNLHVLPPDNLDRLKLDFNASRIKVRLLFILSPT